MHEREKKRQHEGGESILMHSKHILTLVLANSHSHSHSLAYCTVRGKAGTTVSHCAVRCCAVCVRTTAVPFGFGSPRAAAFRISRYGIRRGGDTGTARYVARRRHPYRTVPSGTAQYASVLSRSDFASVRRARPDSVQVGTECGEAATPVLHVTRPGGDTGIVL